MALAAVVLGLALGPLPVREAAGIGVVRGDGRSPAPCRSCAAPGASPASRAGWTPIAPAVGVVGLVAAGIDAGSPAWLSVLRTLVGAAFLGVMSDSMLLGHWYLVQPGLARGRCWSSCGSPACCCRSRWR